MTDNWHPVLTPFEQQTFRELSQEEVTVEREAILWLHNRRLDACTIKSLSFRSIDENRKTIEVKREGKRIILVRQIPFSKTPLEKQIENAITKQKSSYFIFSRAGRRGRVRAYTPSLRREDVNRIVYEHKNKNKKKSIWTKYNQKSIINW